MAHDTPQPESPDQFELAAQVIQEQLEGALYERPGSNLGLAFPHYFGDRCMNALADAELLVTPAVQDLIDNARRLYALFDDHVPTPTEVYDTAFEAATAFARYLLEAEA